jgi:hypothetical protein
MALLSRFLNRVLVIGCIRFFVSDMGASFLLVLITS